MLKLMLLEDETEHAARLQQYLERYKAGRKGFEYTLAIYDRAVNFLQEYRRDADLVFLDIKLPDMLGIEAAKKLREVDDAVMIVFVTNLAQYAIEGYAVSAFDYILKPLKYYSFTAKLERAVRVLEHRSTEKGVDIRTRSGARRVLAGDIKYIEVSSHDLLFHLGTETLKSWGTLTAYAEELRDYHFIRSSASYLVNLKYVEGIQREEITVAGDRIPLTRSKRKAFITAFAQYQGGSI